MKEASTDYLPLELTYTIPKPFFIDPGQAHVELPPYFETDPRSGTSSRSVPVQVEAFLPSWQGQGSQRPFEEVEFALYGVIKSQIHRKVTVQKTLYSTELRKWSDFERHQRGKHSEKRPKGGRYYCDLVFAIDGPRDLHKSSEKPQLLPSIDIRASRYVTQSTALNDQHLVTGRCEIFYCVEARLVSRDGRYQTISAIKSGYMVAQLVRSTIINIQPNPSTVCLTPPRKILKSEDEPFAVVAEAKSSNMLRMMKQCQSLLSSAPRQVVMHPRIMFSIKQALAQSQYTTTSSASVSTFIIPVTMTVSIPNISDATTVGSSIDALRQYLIKAGSPNTIIVASTWHTKYTFTNSIDSPSDPYNTIENNTVRRGTQVVKFPPFYEISDDQYIATAEIEISMPAGMPPTSNYGLLKVQHFLSLAFELREKETKSAQNSIYSGLPPLAGMKTKNIKVECLVDV